MDTPVGCYETLPQSAAKINSWTPDWLRLLAVTGRALRPCSTAVVLAGAVLQAPPALAWGDLGHRVTASIAQARLTPSARAEVERLLASSDLLATPECPVSTLGDASVWADCVRSFYRPRFGYTARWHYVDVPVCGAFDLPRVCPGGQCVVGQLARWRTVLADRSEPQRRRVEALMWVTHLVGDVHQPLHVGDNGDRGGNEVAVVIDGREGRGVNLHSIWDRDLIEKLVEREGGRDALVAHAAVRRRSRPSGSIVDWAAESWAAARGVAYRALPVPVACGGARSSVEEVGPDYERVAEPVVRTRIVLAGERLGDLLNDTFLGASVGWKRGGR